MSEILMRQEGELYRPCVALGIHSVRPHPRWHPLADAHSAGRV